MILVCRSVTIKNRVHQLFRSGTFDVTPLCLTEQELRYFYEEYPPGVSETIEKFVLQSCLRDLNFRGLSPDVLGRSVILDPMLQLLKQAQKQQARLPYELKKVADRFWGALPDPLKSLQFDEAYWERLARLISGKRLVCLGFYEWSDEDRRFFEGCRSYCDEIRLLLPYHPLNQQHLFMQRFYQELADLGAKVQVPVAAQSARPVSLYEAVDPDDELETICQRIFTHIKEGTPPYDIGIVLPDLGESRQRLATIASDLGLPLSMSVGTPLIESPISDLILSAISSYAERFPAAASFEIFSQVLMELVDRHALRSRFQELTPELATIHAHALSQVEERLDELSCIFTQVMSQSDAFRLLELFCHNVEIRPLAPAEDAVQVFSKKEALSCYRPILFIYGFQEGKWPDRVYKSPFLSSDQNRDLRLNDNAAHYQFHLYLFDILLQQCPSLHLSYSSYSEEIEQRPSHFSRFCSKIIRAKPLSALREREKEYQRQLGLYLQHSKSPQSAPKPLSTQLESIEARREKVGAYWGTFDSEAAVARISTVLADRPVSATSLDLYQSCPYAFYYRELLRFREEEESPASLNPMDWGTLVHEILQHALAASPTPNKAVLLREMSASLSRAQLSEFAKQVAHDKLAGTDSREGVLDWYLSDRESLPQTYRPLHFEYVLEGKDDALQLDLGPKHIPIRGSIDVIYGNSEGDLLILDYKTGASIPSASELERYEKCQLPLYLLAFLQSEPRYKAAALAYHQLYKADKHEIQVKLCDPEKREDILGKSRKRPKALDDRFFEGLRTHLLRVRGLQEQGFFSPFETPELPNPIKNRPKTCSSCTYKLLCRYEKRFEGDRL